ncbi:phosphate acetyltransferase [Candidatus Micrarchaeota archaeon]|jgi:phosphate acetyltransferase|nr:phosphate acetyltransferase [Candidatus Micrarchaeota archaeon]
MKKLISEVKGAKCRIGFPEAEDERILKAVNKALKNEMIIPVFIGKKDKIIEKINELNLKELKNVEIINIDEDKLQYACKLLNENKIQGIIAGAVYTSKKVLIDTIKLIGTEEGNNTISSFFLMYIPEWEGGENSHLILADCAVNINPSEDRLADIAISTAKSAKKLFNWDPRIAMLSFSTKGSASHEMIDKIRNATELAKGKVPDLKIDGEIQADSALKLETAKRKMTDVGEVAGKANILIFPDLNSANISHKLIEILSKGAEAYGPILQGTRKPISDLSRGATEEDIYGTITIVCKKILSEEKI